VGVLNQEAQYPTALETAATCQVLELHTAGVALAVDYTN
jgi:hypothetical protein